MKESLFQNKLRVKKSAIEGYGVFAQKNIRKDEMIEECYGLSTSDDLLIDYLFEGKTDHYLLLTGYGSIYNYSKNPNATYYVDVDNKIITFFATKLIRTNEEICISYGKEWFSSRDLASRELSLRQRLSQHPFSFLLVRVTVAITGSLLAIHLLKYFLV